MARIVLAQPFALVLDALARLFEASGLSVVGRCHRAKARRSQGRLRATANFRGVSAEAGTYAAVTVREKTKSGWREHSRLFKLC